LAELKRRFERSVCEVPAITVEMPETTVYDALLSARGAA
jgi:hypothetical protein